MKRKYHEEKLTRLEKTRKSALEMAQEKNEKKKESSEDAQEVTLTGYQGSVG
ncbi:MAG: hypothetical protein LHW59_10100 [Candidatus Cloacimonetes bacterium]|nr:hypothetical protein [Candidatus Cloacimonadota bacterium]